MKLYLKLYILMLFMFPVSLHSQDLQKILEKGISYMDSGKYEESRNAFNEFIRYDSTSARAWNCIGLTFLLQDNADSAIYYFNRALKTDPEYFNAVFNLGRAHAQLAKYREALVFFYRYAADCHDTSDVWVEIARIYEYQGAYDSALYFANIAIDKNPYNFEAIGQRMFINMILENFKDCEDDARHILSDMPDDLTAIYCLAYSLMESGNYEESISQIQHGIELAPRLAAFYSLMSRVLTRQGSFVESGMFISRALDLAPQENGNYLIKAQNTILSITAPSVLKDDIWPPRFRGISSNEINIIDKYASDRKNSYYYKTLEDRFQNDFNSLKLDEYFMLYYGQTLSENYAPYGRNSQDITDNFHTMLNNKLYSEAAEMGSKWLEKNLSDISMYYRTGVAYLAAWNYPKAEEFFHKYQGFITSILATGDGKGPESAYIVISTAEEYTLMEYLGLKVSGQLMSENKGHYFDILTGKTPSGKEKQVYFNIDKPFGSLSKSLR